MNPFIGTWVANIERSRRHANHQFQSATLSFEVSGDIVSLTQVGAHVLESEATKDGRVVGRGTYAVSGDSQTLTATVAGTDAAGAQFEQVIVFDRG